MTTLHDRPAETEQERARPAHDPRLRMSLIRAPLYLIASGLLAWWASDSITDHQWVLEILAGISALLFVIHAVRAFGIWRREHR